MQVLQARVVAFSRGSPYQASAVAFLTFIILLSSYFDISFDVVEIKGHRNVIPIIFYFFGSLMKYISRYVIST